MVYRTQRLRAARGREIVSPACEAFKGEIKRGFPPAPAAQGAAKLSQSFDSLEKGTNVETPGLGFHRGNVLRRYDTAQERICPAQPSHLNMHFARTPMLNISRRQFLGTGAAFALAHSFHAQEGPEPILDLHQHTPYNNRPRDLVLAHQDQHHVKTTVILPGEGWMLKIIGGNRDSAAFEAAHSDRYVRFTSADPAESLAVDVLRGNLQRGAIGIGEMKYRVAVDSPEMHRVYKLAEEMQVPVLIHFEYETYNTGLSALIRC
jgi:hypothetical protein